MEATVEWTNPKEKKKKHDYRKEYSGVFFDFVVNMHFF